MSTDRVDLWALSDLCTPWCLHVAATLRVADHIADGAADIHELATRVSCDPIALGAMLRHLVGKGVFVESSPGQFSLNVVAEHLRHPGVLVGLDLNGIGGRMAHAWGTMLTYVKSGRAAYSEVYGLPFWQDLDANPEVAASFDELIGPTGHGTSDPNVLLDGNWSNVQMVVDVGGGTGALLAEILRAHPEVRGILVDLPRTVARSTPVFEAAGVSDRVTTSGQSFFDPLPGSGDVYILKSILNDWPDEESKMILRRCAEAARPDSRIVISGGVSPDEQLGGLVIEMVLLGGRTRSLSEFKDFAKEAGLDYVASGRQPSGRFSVECRPA